MSQSNNKIVWGRNPRGLVDRNSMRFWRRNRTFPYPQRNLFDYVIYENTYLPVRPVRQESHPGEFTEPLLRRNIELSPTHEEHTSLLALLKMVQSSLEKLIVTLETFDECELQESHNVGSFAKGTMLTGRNIADIVVLVNKLPTYVCVEEMGNRMLADLMSANPNDDLSLRLNKNEKGTFDIVNSHAIVRIRLATKEPEQYKMNPDVHVDIKAVQKHLDAIKHSVWFEKNAKEHSQVGILVRLLRDMRRRFDAFIPLTTWMMELMAHHAVVDSLVDLALPINAAFWQLLQTTAAGLDSSGTGIMDENNPLFPVYKSLTLPQNEHLRLTAQMIVRLMSQGGIRAVLSGQTTSLITPYMWNNVGVSPIDKDLDETTEVPAHLEVPSHPYMEADGRYSPDVFSHEIYPPEHFPHGVYSPGIFPPVIFTPAIYSSGIYQPQSYSHEMMETDDYF